MTSASASEPQKAQESIDDVSNQDDDLLGLKYCTSLESSLDKNTRCSTTTESWDKSRYYFSPPAVAAVAAVAFAAVPTTAASSKLEGDPPLALPTTATNDNSSSKGERQR